LATRTKLRNRTHTDTAQPLSLESLVVAVVEPPADLERGERVGAGVHELVVRERGRVPGAHAHVVRLLHLHAHHLQHQRLQPRAEQVGPPERVGGEASQVHRARDPQPVPGPQLCSVVADPDADEGEPAVGEEGGQLGRDVVGAEDLEDEAAVVDADLQHGDGAGRRAAGGAPLHVEAGDVAAAVHAVGLGHPPVHHVAGVRERRVDVVLVERHNRGAVLVVALDLSRHGPPVLSLSLSVGVTENGGYGARWGRRLYRPGREQRALRLP
jgi:hypothetical protein